MSLVFFDMDGTTINYPHGKYGSSWDAVLYAAGMLDEAKELLEYYLPRPHLYNEWFDKECALLKGVSVEAVETKVLPPVYSDGAREAVHELNEMGLIVGLITAGTNPPARHIADELDMKFCECNDLLHENGYYTGKGKNNVPLWDKKQNMIDVCSRFGIKPDDNGVYKGVVMIGDHENELESFEIAEHSIAYRPGSEKVRHAADYVVNDLRHVPVIIRKLNV
ncbi:MAG: HAD-IB family phosphatase [Candidatus Aenigmatarchaeota archaeon]